MPYPVPPPPEPPQILVADPQPTSQPSSFRFDSDRTGQTQLPQAIAPDTINPPPNPANLLPPVPVTAPLQAQIPDAGIPINVPLPKPTSNPPPPIFRDSQAEDFRVPQLPSGNTTAVTEDLTVTANTQNFNQQEQVFTAEGNAIMRYRGTLLNADRLQVNLRTRTAVAQGDVAYQSGRQKLFGDRMRYDLARETGTIQQARGTIFLPSAQQDFAPTSPANTTSSSSNTPLSDRVFSTQPLEVSPGAGGANLGVDVGVGTGATGVASPDTQSGGFTQVRFEAEQLQVTPEGWQATDISFTNDPFSPPELQLKASEARTRPLENGATELRAENPRLVFDRGFTLPLLRERVVINEEQEDPLVRFGFDRTERGGLFIERDFSVISREKINLSLTPQFFVQRAIQGEGGFLDPSQFGLLASLDATITPTTFLAGSAELSSLALNDEEEFRGSLRLRQSIGNHLLSGEYSFRDRLFNGSLGFRTVHQSIGAVLLSPNIEIGNTGITLNYQGSINRIEADTDRLDLLEPFFVRENDRTELTRYQASASLTRAFSLWRGEALPATAEAGLRYTPVPVVPYVRLITSVRGVASAYSNGDEQNSLSGSITLQGQFGHFSRDFWDYTAFSIGYSQVLLDGESPFFFDRLVDTQVLNLAISQQIYGPFRLGVEAAINLDTNEVFSSDFILQYNRRTYGITLRFNPEQQVGGINLRISDFNWTGNTTPFSGNVDTVDRGVRRD
ncbi:DUF3769 domain-containing protein [Geitlerinema sp. PCC 9228]|uniref:DUF3769 domain-containing protein n=1 Tax=Geitlerinema sp. PCC 9228 TaxID=111611 RepID=UPI0008F99C17|nr:DUF3769 domain-containing protein [Geitlerinema sp. PCC 9228]